MTDELQALCFFAGANSIFYGDRLLTTGNPEVDHDRELFARLGLQMEEADLHARETPGACERCAAG
jgi:biotin synthase